MCIISHNLSNNGHVTLVTLPFCNLTSILKCETIFIFEFQRLVREMRQIMLVSNLGRLCKLVHPSNSHALLTPEVSNNPIKIWVLNSGLIWILHHSSNNQIIEMIPDIKFAITNLSEWVYKYYYLSTHERNAWPVLTVKESMTVGILQAQCCDMTPI